MAGLDSKSTQIELKHIDSIDFRGAGAVLKDFWVV